MPDGVQKIWSYACYNAYNLSRVELPATLTDVDSYAFRACDYFTSVICHALTPPASGEGIFNSIPKNAVLYVPADAVETYKSSDWATYFLDIRPIVSDGIVDVQADSKQCSKIVENGTLYIVRPDGTVFNAQGSEVR